MLELQHEQWAEHRELVELEAIRHVLCEQRPLCLREQLAHRLASGHGLTDIALRREAFQRAGADVAFWRGVQFDAEIRRLPQAAWELRRDYGPELDDSVVT